MRKNIVRTAAALVACAGVLSVGGSVYATDLSTSGLNIYNGLGDHITFVRSYDADNDINEVTVTVLADESNLSAILAQHPGTGSVLSDFYIGFQVESMKDIAPNKVLKNGVWTEKTAGKTNAQIKDEVTVKVDDDDPDSNDETTFWPVSVFIQYNNGTEWVKSDATGDGTTTIADDLVAKLGLTDASELEYGVNYRIGMWTDWYYSFAFKDISNAAAEHYEYIKLDFEIKFPVTGTKDDGEAIYYTNLAKAIADGATDIVINEDTDVDDDLTIPAGVTVTVADGATLTIADGKKITVEEGADLRGADDVEGEVEYIDEDEEVDEEENPETGDNIVVALAASGVALAGLLASVVIAKKQ